MKRLACLLTTLLILAPMCSGAGEWDFDPAPGDWSKYNIKREPGQFKRTPSGMIDPSPDVISLEYLPKDKYGFVDWAKAIKDGIIAPKETLKGAAGPVPEAIPDIIIKSKMDFMPDVIFPHAPHTTWLNCNPCHPKIFEKKAGATPITMVGIWQGQFCGRCHDKVAFPTRNCFKCHSAPRKTKKK